MTTLYAFANMLGYRVLGTGNLDELTVGYFTKYGDGGVDLLPLGSLTKGEVRDLARELGVPRQVIDKPPSAGLWADQTDEGEMGLTYAAARRLPARRGGPGGGPPAHRGAERRQPAQADAAEGGAAARGGVGAGSARTRPMELFRRDDVERRSHPRSRRCSGRSAVTGPARARR